MTTVLLGICKIVFILYVVSMYHERNAVSVCYRWWYESRMSGNQGPHTKSPQSPERQ